VWLEGVVTCRLTEQILPWNSNKYYIFKCVCVCTWDNALDFVRACVRV
jgi:hypothetical protein